ncbi:hypothetical protein ACFVKB_07925 [Rhodococcus sp. NPDC127530]|uniref:hypothetical protein n=1 Tax=unclassified Rhodococcus (in: high G+C Gram-positive bacteria) TaxID=192944 RepID=UPI00364060D0
MSALLPAWQGKGETPDYRLSLAPSFSLAPSAPSSRGCTPHLPLLAGAGGVTPRPLTSAALPCWSAVDEVALTPCARVAARTPTWVGGPGRFGRWICEVSIE